MSEEAGLLPEKKVEVVPAEVRLPSELPEQDREEVEAD